MPKWVKQKYRISLGLGGDEVEGTVCGQWGIDKRDNRYYLTHIPTGYLVESARTMKFLKDMVATPEFECYDGSKTALKNLVNVIARFRNEYGWTA